MPLIYAITFVALGLLIWFDTSAFIEYLKLFRLTWLFKVADYLKIEYPGSYQDFLLEYFPGFLSSLVSCPICTSVWLGIASVFIYGLSALSMPCVTFAGLLLYKAGKKIIIK